MEKSQELKDFFGKKDEEPKKEVKSFVKQAAKGQGKVANITDKWVIIDHNGNGVRIPFSPEKHKSLKIGDPIDVS